MNFRNVLRLGERQGWVGGWVHLPLGCLRVGVTVDLSIGWLLKGRGWMDGGNEVTSSSMHADRRFGRESLHLRVIHEVEFVLCFDL
jgi:hypothetical protein